MEQIKYGYHNLPIPGGGYVTGFRYHPTCKGILYARTDIGGTYRYDGQTGVWKSLIDHVTMEDLSETYPIAIALDPAKPQRLYIASGIFKNDHGKFSVSEDYGETFRYYKMPMRVHGNLNGRGTGYRLTVDKKNNEVLYFASQQDGLWKTCDKGATWEKLPAMKEQYLTLVAQTEDGSAMIVGTAGVTTLRGENLRGRGLYVSYDQGQSFEVLSFAGQELCDVAIEGVRLAGLVPHRLTMDNDFVYVTYGVMGRNAYVLENGYSCDGGSVIGGRVVRYPLERGKEGTRIGTGQDITPWMSQEQFESAGRSGDGKAVAVNSGLAPEEILECGFGGIDMSSEGVLVTATICTWNGDRFYRSFDQGATWECILWGLKIGRMDFRAPYMRPCCNGGGNLIHWQTDVKIDPFDPETLWFNTGTGVFVTHDLKAETVVFSDHCDGIEETVHLNLYSPPSGPVQLIDILGDLGGFAFTDVDKPCDNSFADGEGNRYITCINADYSDLDPSLVVVTPRGNWTGRTKGGLILSKDQCRTFTRLDMPWGLSEDLDEALRQIEQPNVNSGWVSLSPDGQHIVWNVAQRISLPVTRAIVSHDQGQSFELVKVYDTDGNLKTEGGFKCFADRTDSSLFYGFGDHFDFYISKDSGATFRQRTFDRTVPDVKFTLIDCANKTEVRGESGKQGIFYMALGKAGLWKLHYDRESDKVSLTCLSKEGDTYYRLGLGIGREGGDYFKEPKAIYTSAVINGTYGFYRTCDEGASYARLNEAHQMFGEINSMEGDSRVFGRFYLATGSRGVVYGQEV